MLNTELEAVINTKLVTTQFRDKDYAPNGLQVEGRKKVKKIITGVTACQALLEQAIAQQADAILVHHGYFWKNEPSIVCGMKRQRLKTLLLHDINLYAYHLPLDAHPELGNNAQLAKLLHIEPLAIIDQLILEGKFEVTMSACDLQRFLEKKLGREILHCGDNASQCVQHVALCTGAGQGYIQTAAQLGVDAFITGEVSEQTIHIAREMGINFYAAGHHATERYGIQALGQWLSDTHQLAVNFIDIANPA